MNSAKALVFAREFLSAAKAAGEVRKTTSIPAYYLAGHSIELCLKSFLLSRGETIEVLRRKPFGHDLEALLKEARRRRLGTEVKLTKTELKIIYMLNSYYSRKDLEYVNTVYLTLPPWAELFATATKLEFGLRSLAVRHF